MSLQQQLYDQVLEKVAPGKIFLMNKTSVLWDWGKKVGYIDTKDYQVAGTMPAIPDAAVGPYYSSTGIDTYRQYVTTLNSVKLEVSAEHQQQLNQLNEAIDAIIAKDQATWIEYQAALKRDNPSPEDLDMWKKLNGWDLKLTTNDAERAALQQKKENITAISNADFTSALAAINNKEGFTQMLKAGAVAKVPNYLISDFGIQWRDKVAGGKGTPVTITFSSSKTYKSTSQYKFSAGVSVFYYFSASGGAQKQTVNLEEDETSVTIKYDALTMVNVTPDADWFHQPYLNTIAQEGKWRDGRTTDQILGPEGFHSIVTGYVASYRPSLTITSGKNTISQMSKAVGAQGGFGFGPWRFGGSGGTAGSKFTQETSSGSITIKSNADYGEIVGYIVQRPFK